MRCVVQRVSQAKVEVDGVVCGKISKGLLVFVAFTPEDTINEIQWMSDKLLKLRIFQDSNGKMNQSVMDIAGEMLLVSQFTLYADAQKGNRPSFVQSAGADIAEKHYNQMIHYLNSISHTPIETGIFGAMMCVELINDGPVTILLEK